jgi:hypothetical protein
MGGRIEDLILLSHELPQPTQPTAFKCERLLPTNSDQQARNHHRFHATATLLPLHYDSSQDISHGSSATKITNKTSCHVSKFSANPTPSFKQTPRVFSADCSTPSRMSALHSSTMPSHAFLIPSTRSCESCQPTQAVITIREQSLCSKGCGIILPCGHQCPSICGKDCPIDCHQRCGLRQDDRPDVLPPGPYSEKKTPSMAPECEHFSAIETLESTTPHRHGSDALAKVTCQTFCPTSSTSFSFAQTWRWSTYSNRTHIVSVRPFIHKHAEHEEEQRISFDLSKAPDELDRELSS